MIICLYLTVKQSKCKLDLRTLVHHMCLYLTVKQSKCKLDLRTLVHHKRDEYGEDYRNKEQLMDTMLAETSSSVPVEWKPQGILVSHIHEHKDSVSR